MEWGFLFLAASRNGEGKGQFFAPLSDFACNKAKKNNWLNKYSAGYTVCNRFFRPYSAILTRMLVRKKYPGREAGVGAVREPPLQMLVIGVTFPARS